VAAIMADHTLVARRPVWQRLHYGAASLLDYLQASGEVPGQAYLQLPADRNPQAAALGDAWRRTHDTPEAMVAAGLAFFREKGFRYTLRPDRSGLHAVDDFLFSSRKGFCEHFASAFTVLMRAAGVPTRMVGGYQGGKWNGLGAFLTVRHADAHVWCEVWLAGTGWVRVDPTFTVAPDRIDAGIDIALAGEERLWFLNPGQALFMARWAETVRQTWEAVNTRWNMWFMGFSAEDQIALMKRLGIAAGQKGVWLSFLLLPGLFIAAVVLPGRLRARASRRAVDDEALKIYNRFLHKMARGGMPKARHQGPLDFARWVAEKSPALAPDVNDIIDRYIDLRYGHVADVKAVKVLRQRVHRFSLRRAVSAGSRRPQGATPER